MPPPKKIPGRPPISNVYTQRSSPTNNSSPLSPPSASYSTESDGSSISIDETDFPHQMTPDEHLYNLKEYQKYVEKCLQQNHLFMKVIVLTVPLHQKQQFPRRTKQISTGGITIYLCLLIKVKGKEAQHPPSQIIWTWVLTVRTVAVLEIPQIMQTRTCQCHLVLTTVEGELMKP